MRKHIQFLIIFTLIFTACKEEKAKKEDQSNIKPIIELKYAKGFEIQYFKKYKKLHIISPFLNSKDTITYTIFTKRKDAVLFDNMPNELLVPIEKMVATSTTHIPMIELLNGEQNLIGFPHTKYVSSKKTRALIDAGKIQELGREAELNTEVLIDLKPELIVGFSMYGKDKSYDIVKNAGIPVVLNGDWLEETPLGRAEWIKFFGILLNKEKEADSIFKTIEQDYLEAIKIAKKANNKATILSGAVMSKDIWNLPAGESFVAQYLKDANLDYPWKDSKGKGSLSLSFESVFDKGQSAQYWIAPGYFTTKEQLLKNNKLYAKFDAFKNDQIYTPSTKKGATGGVIYYELAPSRPDLVLKDIIKITNPELLPNYEFTFFEKMQ
ncbi:ABC transporter substrate-binding protein [Flavobacteriaceae bacterium S356]|uniref:ABC transporter substrate-binding protein n=1 Tax=Asprobacillus argus TaxID=3076534 RepID=A0ABU3LER5_9FLAO|nr:ABC transporter substrate-binding protein [Flavobacteriaceae bacterium S356]